jgi:hypothetical protein
VGREQGSKRPARVFQEEHWDDEALERQTREHEALEEPTLNLLFQVSCLLLITDLIRWIK